MAFLLSSHHAPGQINPGPSLLCIGSCCFAFVVRFKSEKTFVKFQRAHRRTIGAFNKVRATVQKTPGFDWDHPGKRAFGCPGRLHLISYGVAGSSSLHRCVTRHVLRRVRSAGGLTRRSSARNRGRISEQTLEFLLALRFGLFPFEFPCAGLTFHTRPQIQAARHVFATHQWLRWLRPVDREHPRFRRSNHLDTPIHPRLHSPNQRQ